MLDGVYSSYNEETSGSFNLPSNSREEPPITDEMILRRLRKPLKQMQRENENEPLMRSNLEFMTSALRSFSVIFLTMVGFILVPESLTVRCSKCPAEYTVDEMERNPDDELNRRHAAVNPRCTILQNIWREYLGALRLPQAEMTAPKLPPKQRQPSSVSSNYSNNYNSFNMVTVGQPGIKVQNSNTSSPSLPVSLTTTQQPSSQGQVPMRSRGPDLDEGFQDDIISDSLPGETFSGSFPRSEGEYSNYNARLQSFSSSWQNRAKKKSRPSPEVLAEAGFYEWPDERKDAVKCHACDLVMFGWNDGEEDIWRKHVLQSPSCPFIRQQKGEAFIQNVLDKMDSLNLNSTQSTNPERKTPTREDLAKFDIPSSWISSVTDMGFGLDALLLVYLYKRSLLPEGKTQVFDAVDQVISWILSKKEEAEENFDKFAEYWPGEESHQSSERDTAYGTDEHEKSDNIQTDAGLSTTQTDEAQNCKICFSKQANMLLRPCSHMVSCESCTRRLKLCPICRDPISAVIPVTW